MAAPRRSALRTGWRPGCVALAVGLALLGGADGFTRVMRGAMMRRGGAVSMMAGGSDKMAVMISGLPGAMGKEVAAACLRRGLTLCPWGLTGPDVEDTEVKVDDMEGGKPVTIKLVKGPSKGDGAEECDARIQGLMAGYRATSTRLIVVDYTHPSAVNNNARLYVRHGMDFVMGTTGGDREALMKDVAGGDISAVIAPNMGKQIVALQAALDIMAKEFPGSFEGYDLKVVESHQSSKADTSGTAKALVGYFATLTGSPQDVGKIQMLRDKASQTAFGVPESALGGHAFHTYTLTSTDGSVQFALQHNVCGRRIYAEGTVDAVVFLAQQPRTGKRVFNMIDVLKAGAM